MRYFGFRCSGCLTDIARAYPKYYENKQLKKNNSQHEIEAMASYSQHFFFLFSKKKKIYYSDAKLPEKVSFSFHFFFDIFNFFFFVYTKKIIFFLFLFRSDLTCHRFQYFPIFYYFMIFLFSRNHFRVIYNFYYCYQSLGDNELLPQLFKFS